MRRCLMFALPWLTILVRSALADEPPDHHRLALLAGALPTGTLALQDGGEALEVRGDLRAAVDLSLRPASAAVDAGLRIEGQQQFSHQTDTDVRWGEPDLPATASSTGLRLGAWAGPVTPRWRLRAGAGVSWTASGLTDHTLHRLQTEVQLTGLYRWQHDVGGWLRVEAEGRVGSVRLGGRMQLDLSEVAGFTLTRAVKSRQPPNQQQAWLEIFRDDQRDLEHLTAAALFLEAPAAGAVRFRAEGGLDLRVDTRKLQSNEDGVPDARDGLRAQASPALLVGLVAHLR